MELTSKQRAQLRGLANTIDTILKNIAVLCLQIQFLCS